MFSPFQILFITVPKCHPPDGLFPSMKGCRVCR